MLWGVKEKLNGLRDVEGESGSHFSGLALAKCMEPRGRWRAGSELQRKCLGAAGHRQTFPSRVKSSLMPWLLEQSFVALQPPGRGRVGQGWGCGRHLGGPPHSQKGRRSRLMPGWTSRSCGSLSNASFSVRTGTPCQFLFTAVCAVLPRGPGTCWWDA